MFKVCRTKEDLIRKARLTPIFSLFSCSGLTIEAYDSLIQSAKVMEFFATWAQTKPLLHCLSITTCNLQTHAHLILINCIILTVPLGMISGCIFLRKPTVQLLSDSGRLPTKKLSRRLLLGAIRSFSLRWCG